MPRKVVKSAGKKNATQKRPARTSTTRSLEQVDPRQALFLAAYCDPESPTFGNALQSALAAKYSQEYAESLTHQMPVWLSEKLGELNADGQLSKAQRNLHLFLDLNPVVPAMGAFGPIVRKEKAKVRDGTYQNGKPKWKTVEKQVPVMTTSTKILELKQKTTHFVAETVGKKLYSKAMPREGNTNLFMLINNVTNQAKKDYS